MKLNSNERALLHKLVEEAGEVIKAASDILQNKGGLSELADELADVKAAAAITVSVFELDHYDRLSRKLKKYARRYNG